MFFMAEEAEAEEEAAPVADLSLDMFYDTEISETLMAARLRENRFLEVLVGQAYDQGRLATPEEIQVFTGSADSYVTGILCSVLPSTAGHSAAVRAAANALLRVQPWPPLPAIVYGSRWIYEPAAPVANAEAAAPVAAPVADAEPAAPVADAEPAAPVAIVRVLTLGGHVLDVPDALVLRFPEPPLVVAGQSWRVYVDHSIMQGQGYLCAHRGDVVEILEVVSHAWVFARVTDTAAPVASSAAPPPVSPAEAEASAEAVAPDGGWMHTAALGRIERTE